MMLDLGMPEQQFSSYVVLQEMDINDLLDNTYMAIDSCIVLAFAESIILYRIRLFPTVAHSFHGILTCPKRLSLYFWEQHK